MRRAAFLVVGIALCAQPAAAQHAPAGFAARPIVPAAAAGQAAAMSGGSAYAYEALGGIAGSMAGFGIGVALSADNCDGEDLSCILNAVGLALLLSTATSTAGTYVAGRAFDTDPSVVGAALGSVAGAVAGVGAWHLVNEELNIASGQVAAILTYSVVQGAVTALGSRIARSLSR